MKTFAKAIALIAVVGGIVSVADPSSRPTVGRMAVFAVAVVAAATLTNRLAQVAPRGESSPFEPLAAPAPPPAVPTELAELSSSLRALDAGRRVDGQLRAALHEVAASRLARRGIEVDAPEHRAEVDRLLGEPLARAIRDRATPADPDDLVTPLEAL